MSGEAVVDEERAVGDREEQTGGAERRERSVSPTTDFAVLRDDLRPTPNVRPAPNPLRAADAQRLHSYRETVRRISAARRAAGDDGNRY